MHPIDNRLPRALFTAPLILGFLGLSSAANAQALGDLALNNYQPPEAGDDFMAVPSAEVGGHLVPRAQLIFDYAHRPFVLVDSEDNIVGEPVSGQAFLHLGASFALWDRLLVAASFPLAIAQSGDDLDVGTGTFTGASGAAAGDLRLGLRGRIFGEADDPLQLAAGGFLFAPTGSDTYSGDGSFYGEPHLILSGRVPNFTYSANLGAVVKSSDNPSTFVYRAGVAALLLEDEALMIGPELVGSVNLGDGVFFEGSPDAVEREGDVTAEILGSVQYRLPFGLVLGAAAGPGIASGVGTPAFRVLGRVSYDPKVEEAPRDSDRDGIVDEQDACVDVPGVAHSDPQLNGCPPDRDRDGIVDSFDACPNDPGPASEDPSKHGCPLPADSDGDGIVDAMDACPTVAGVASDDPQRHGCPLVDTDGDGVYDANDACPAVPGVASADPAKNGCPGDRDKDGIVDADDACPDQAGPPNADPSKHGCPRVVITEESVVILQKVEFDTAKATIKPVSNELLDDVAKVLTDNPDLVLIEVQGHTDNRGNAAYNSSLSQQRADAVKAALVKRGVDTGRLQTKGYGPNKPIATNDTDEGRATNRRVEFKIIKREKK